MRHSPPPTGTIVNTDRLVNAEVLRQSEFHNDYLRRYEIGRCLVAIVDDGRSPALPRIRLTIMRAASEPAFSVAEVGRLWHLVRLARSFVRLAATHETMSRTACLHQRTIDLVRMPIMVAARDRCLFLANQAANALLRSDDPLLVRHGCVRARDPRADKDLDAALNAVATTPGDIRFVRLGPGRPIRQAPALLINALTDQRGGAAALILRVLGTGTASGTSDTLLTQVLGLTPAESAVALGLAEGLSHEEIACRRGVKVTTIRTILRRLQEKLGIERSGALARFVSGVVASGGLEFEAEPGAPGNRPPRPS